MRRSALPLLVALGAVFAVLVPYLALGGASYEPAAIADPCAPRDWRNPGGLQEVLEQIALSTLDGAACELGVSREDLVLAVRDEEALETFAAEQGITRAEAEAAVEHGLERAVQDAEDAEALPGFAAALLRQAVDALPPWLLLDALEGLQQVVS